ncbi:MAG: hypothetical protein ACO33A_14160 [Hyphomonas sp.]
MKRDTSRLASRLLASCALALTGCVSLASIEPIKNPPADFQRDVVVHTEFLQPSKVGQRCAQRGVTLFGVPAPGAMACASPSLMTVPNACDTVTGGWYADAVCAAIAHSHGWEAGSGARPGLLMPAAWSADGAAPAGPDAALRPEGEYRAGTAIRVEFVDAARIGIRCAQRGAVDGGRPTLGSVACANGSGLSLVNPCSVVDGGWYADLLCHEMGHVNGWPASHPGGSFLKDGRVPSSHTPPLDQDSLLLNIQIATRTAIANQSRRDLVYAVTPASLAGSPALARQIADKAGLMRLPDMPLPRIDQVPEIRRAGLALPMQIAGFIAALDPARPFAALTGPARPVLIAEAASAPAAEVSGPASLHEAPAPPQAELRLALADPQPTERIPPGLRLRAIEGRVPPPLPAVAAVPDLAAAAALPALAPAPEASPPPRTGLSQAAFGGHLAETHPWLVTGSVMLLVPLD